MEYEFPRNTPKFTKEALRETLSVIHSILKDNLIGIYLYGSLAMGGFHPQSSDIDIFLVIEKRLSKSDGRKTINYLKRACSNGKRIELSIMRADIIQNPRYPIPVDLHYEYWNNTFENETDKETLSNLYTTKERGFCVWGRPIKDVFSRIPAQYHLRSVIEDLEHTRRYLHEEPESIGYDVTVYWVLNSCRILAFVREQKVLSKLEGGRWGQDNLPKEYHQLVRQALSCHSGKEKVGRVWNHEELNEFADYMTEAILRESGLNQEKIAARPLGC